MSMSLYHIDQELENLIDHETGEVLDFDAFEALQMARDAKIEGVLCWTKNLAAEAKAIREEEKELAERRKAMERKREKLLAYAERALGGAVCRDVSQKHGGGDHRHGRCGAVVHRQRL